ncbi:MAG: aldo/keto reductase [Gemmatimonadota bacterium]|jgi:aryl-alcohol dehydrogenase-like predicted oxidoreductase
MQYARLGDTGLKVSSLCMGAMTFGSGFYGIGEVDRDGARELVQRCLDAGVNFFDTADVYSRGESEELLGRAFDDLGVARDDIVIATKVRGAMSDAAAEGTGDVNNAGLSRKHVIAGCEASLRRLGTDHIDLYQIHGVDRSTPLDETMRALDDLVRAGKVRYVGCSNLAVRHILRANDIATLGGWSPFVSLQAYYSLVCRDLEHELLPLCREEGIGVTVWSPLAGGFLTGKFRRADEKGPAGSRRSGFDFPPLDKEQGYDVVELLEELAEAKGATIPQLALAWLLQRDGVSSVIIGAKRVEQLEDDLGAVDVSFTSDELERIDDLTAPDALYPQWMIERQNAS